MQLPIRVSTALGLCFLALGTIATAQNQYVILYPGANNSSTILQVYLSGLLPTASINTIPAGTFQIIPTPDGTKYYVIANGGAPVSVMDSNFQNVRQIAGSIALAPATAALTPDGRKLVVLAGNVYVIDVNSDAVIAPAGLQVVGRPTDVVISADSTRAFVLSQGSVGASGTVLTSIDLTSTTPAISGSPLTLNGDGSSPALGLAIAPSGFLYLANNYRIFEVNPVTMKVTTNGEIQVQAYPGKPVITPDGKYLVCVNVRPVQGGTSLVQVDLTSKTASYFTNFGGVLDRVIPIGTDAAGNNRLYSVGTGGQLYDVTLGSQPNVTSSAINLAFAQGAEQPTFRGIQFSNEVPPRLMWATNSSGNANFLYQFDIRTQQINQIPAPATLLQLGTLGISPSSGGTALVAYNNNQTVTAGQISTLPIVAKLIDPLGRGIYRGQISFTSATPGVVIQTPSTVTGSGGFGQTYVTAPTTPGTFTVTANGGPGVLPIDFSFVVPGSSGGGGGPTLGGLFYVSGNGQVVIEQNISAKPMVVQVLDTNGKPVSNATVTWTITSGLGSLSGSTQVTTNTDSNGIAGTSFLASAVNPGQSYQQANIQASGPSGNTINFVVTTVLAQLPGGFGFASPPTVAEQICNSDGCILTFPSGRIIRGTAGSLIKGAYKAVIGVTAGVQAGQGIPNVGVRVDNVDPLNSVDTSSSTTGLVPAPNPSAFCVGNPLSDATGLLVCDLQIGPTIGTGSIFFVLGEFNNRPPVTLIVTAGPPGKLMITSGSGQSGKPGEKLLVPFAVKVTDIAGNPLGNVPVAWSTILGSAQLSSTTTLSDVNGNARINVALGSTPGPVKVQATVSKDLFIQIDTNVNVVVSSVTAVSGDNQTAFTNAPFGNPVVVILKDQLGNPVANTKVDFSVTGGGTVNPASANTGVDGTVGTRVTAGPVAGNITVTAISSGFQAQFLNLRVNLPGPQITSSSFLNAASLFQGLTPCGLSVIAAPGIAPGVSGTLQPTGFGPNPTSLGPVQSLTIGGIAAPITSVSNIGGVERVGFQTPCEVPVGSAQVVMNVSGGTTTVNGVPVSQYSPGMFETVATDGKSYAVALRSDGSFIGPSNPASRGETIRVFVTGVGQTNPPIGTNRAGTGGQVVIADVIGGVNNGGVLVVKAEYVAGQIGTYFVDIQIPNDTLTGPYQPIAVAIRPVGGGELLFGNGVYIPIQ